MTEQKKTSAATPAAGISEAERMTKIRELLVGPAIADESARLDKSVDRLDELAREQQEAISTLQARIQDLEDSQRAGLERLQMRLLGIAEALIADEDDVRERLMQNETLLSKLGFDRRNGDA